MKLNRAVALFAVGLSFVTLVRAEDESLSSIFTNAANTRSTVLPRRTSIILIACHDLALGDLSCYGQTNFQTPNLDRLAAEGTRFTDYRAGGDDYSAAEAALVTGNTAAFSARQPTVAARLQQSGYHTGLLGEWTLGSQPWTQGFDEFMGFFNEADARNYYSEFIWWYRPKSNRSVRQEFYSNTGGNKGQYMPDMLLDAVAKFVRVNQPSRGNLYQPFFLLLNLSAPESVTPGKDDFSVPTDAPFTSENWPQAAKNRAALLTRLDAGVGRLFEQLGKTGMSNNLAIFLSGAAAPAPFADTNLDFLKVPGEVRGGKSEGRLRVPMIVRWPGHVPAGRVSDQPWSAPDFASTALEIAYVKPGGDFTGRSVLPALLGAPATNAPALPNGP
jgi:arylsulfatase A-like enzyme